MPGAESTIVLFPRFTTLIATENYLESYSSLPLDVSRFSSAQIQVWRGQVAGPLNDVWFSLEESLDGENWVLGAAAPVPVKTSILGTKYLSYAFRLRWFRLRIEFVGPDALVSCWAEGLLR